MPDNYSSNKSKRILKNTAVLYVRMIVVMAISLYSSRLVLKALGIDDFGLYNVVGGVVGLMTFFNTTMSKSTQRFLNVEMVRSEDSLSRIFSSSITVHLLFAFLFLLLGETVGLWFLNAKVNIPEGREFAANVVYHATILSFCTSVVMTPYNAAVIAYERMTFVAVVSIIDAVLKLGVALSLLVLGSDKLVLYGILLLVITILDFIMYFVFCKRRFPILRFRVIFNKEDFRQIFSFVSWTLLGQFAIVGCNQGNVVLVNMFHSLAANAAMSVGSQVNHAITNLTSNFQTAFNPQITKSFAEGDFEYLKSLVYSTSKISFCILYVVALPISFNIDYILDLWLDQVPFLSSSFAILFLVNGIMNALSSPFNFTVLSSGNIRNFQILVSIIFIIDLPIVYLLFAIGFPPITVMWVKVCVMAVTMFIRIYFASRVSPAIKASSYIRSVLFPLFTVSFITISAAFVLKDFAESLFTRLSFSLLLEIVCLALIWVMCLDKKEKKYILETVLHRIIKR